MKLEQFVSVGENIHCTRIYRVGGKFVQEREGGRHVVAYKDGGESRELSVPDGFRETADWENGKVKHCAVAIWQGNYGDDAGKAAGVDYLQSMARRQAADGATYLDINVDEFSTDVEERVTRIYRMHADKRQRVDRAAAGDVVALVGVKSVVTGDTLSHSIELRHRHICARSCRQAGDGAT